MIEGIRTRKAALVPPIRMARGEERAPSYVAGALLRGDQRRNPYRERPVDARAAVCPSRPRREAQDGGSRSDTCKSLYPHHIRNDIPLIIVSFYHRESRNPTFSLIYGKNVGFENA